MELRAVRLGTGLTGVATAARAGVVWNPTLGRALAEFDLEEADIFYEVSGPLALFRDTVALTLSSGSAAVSAVTAIAASSVNWAVGNYFSKTLAANTTFTFANVATSLKIEVYLAQTAAQAYTVTWPAGITWADGAPGVITAETTLKVMLTATSGSTFDGSFVEDSALPDSRMGIVGGMGKDFEGVTLPTLGNVLALGIVCVSGEISFSSGLTTLRLKEGMEVGMGRVAGFEGELSGSITIAAWADESEFVLLVAGASS